jgi:outer membrane receptor for ferrienterochelin and colicins
VRNLVFLLVFFWFSNALMAQNKVIKVDSTTAQELDAVLVSATRTQRQMSSLPMPTQFIPQKEIEAINAIRLTDLLDEQTGLITVSDFGGGQGVQMQGLDSQYTLVMIDGVPLIGRSAGTLDLSRVTVGNIKQIEIVRGASSSLYGNEALGGVINIITQNPRPGKRTRIDYRAGSFNTHDLRAQYTDNNLVDQWSVFLNRLSSDGYDLVENDDLRTVEPYTNYTAQVKYKGDLNPLTKMQISGRYYTQKQDYTASSNLAGASDINEFNTTLHLSRSPLEHWTQEFEWYTTRYMATEFLNNPDGSAFSESDFDQWFSRPELRLTRATDSSGTWIGGLGLTYEQLKRTDFFGTPEFYAPYAYIQYEDQITKKLNIVAGARYDVHSAYASQFSPKLAARYVINDKISIKSSLGYGFKTPDFRQLYFDFTNTTAGYTVLGYNAVAVRLPELQAAGNIINVTVPLDSFDDPLRPERSLALNLGMDIKFSSQIKWNVNLFRNDIKDLIDTRVIAQKTNGQNVFSYYNVNRVYTQGMETDFTARINQNLKFSMGYQYLIAKDKDAEKAFDNGQVFGRVNPSSPVFRLEASDYLGLVNRSKHTANAKVFFELPQWHLDGSLRATYRSAFGLFDTNGNSYLDQYDDLVAPFAIFDFSLNKALGKKFRVGAGIDNIMDYTDPGRLTNLPGRLIYASLTFKTK